MRGEEPWGEYCVKTEAGGARVHLPVSKRRDCWQHWHLGEDARITLLSELPERTNPADTWILDFKPEL